MRDRCPYPVAMLYPSKSAAAAARASALRKEARNLKCPLPFDRQWLRETREKRAVLLRQANYWDREASRLADAGL